ncbi:hypothetical protein Y032_0071g617 [Ancylostoma ceylanicum]|uniref:Uncharacterized protein n=1 Tax=Ancylostoma ceylanicum TaxID=53326 RepID=A0A016TYD3_9BILA|nr:hypothetical protein Y032_0071g617 [Ancylostoma ceylanicum]
MQASSRWSWLEQEYLLKVRMEQENLLWPNKLLLTTLCSANKFISHANVQCRERRQDLFRLRLIKVVACRLGQHSPFTHSFDWYHIQLRFRCCSSGGLLEWTHLLFLRRKEMQGTKWKWRAKRKETSKETTT